MKKPAKDPVREDRIHNEAIADANGPEEQIVGWHCYLDDKIRFPFQAGCIARRIVSPLREGETVEVHRMAPEDACPTEMLVLNPLARSGHGRSTGPTGGRRTRRRHRRGRWRLALPGVERLSFLIFQSDPPPLHTLAGNSRRI